MIARFRLFALALLTAAATLTGLTLTAPAAHALPADFTVTKNNPTTGDLNNIVEFLVATRASDQAKARNLEGGMNAVIVPKTVYNLGLFRAPRGSHAITAITGRDGNTLSARLRANSAGRPGVNTVIYFKKIGGNWRLANSSVCTGVKTVGLNIYCNA